MKGLGKKRKYWYFQPLVKFLAKSGAFMNFNFIREKLAHLIGLGKNAGGEDQLKNLIKNKLNRIQVKYPHNPVKASDSTLDAKLELLRKHKIGGKSLIATPNLWFGHGIGGDPTSHRLIMHADYTASAQGLSFLERYLQKNQETYANTHTETSAIGKYSTKQYHDSLEFIKSHVGADDSFEIVPTGYGATGAIEKIQKILGIYMCPKTTKNLKEKFGICAKSEFKNKYVVFVGPYEHHSNDVSWQDATYCDFVRVAAVKDADGNPGEQIDLDDLASKLADYPDHIKIVSLSAASNVTGIKTDVAAVSKVTKNHGALLFLDYACSGPYVKIDMADHEIDAIFLSIHKNLGGCNLGLLVFRKSLYDLSCHPSFGGGGTVSAVSPWKYHFVDNIQERETAGTPAIRQVFQAALSFQLKEWVGLDNIHELEQFWTEKAYNFFKAHPNLQLLGDGEADNHLSIFSFSVIHGDRTLHYALVASLLSDVFGIQSRSGCVCAGPFGHVLLNIDKKLSDRYIDLIQHGVNGMKPGWTRINHHYSSSQQDFDYLTKALNGVAYFGGLFLDEYTIDMDRGVWQHDHSPEVWEPVSFERALTKSDLHPHIEEYQREDLRANQITEFCLYIAFSLTKGEKRDRTSLMAKVSPLVEDLLADRITYPQFVAAMKPLVSATTLAGIEDQTFGVDLEKFSSYGEDLPFFYSAKGKVKQVVSRLPRAPKTPRSLSVTS